MNKEFMKPSTKIGAEASYKTMSETWLYWTWRSLGFCL